MSAERTEGNSANMAQKAGRLFGSLKDALIAAGREDTAAPPAAQGSVVQGKIAKVEILPPVDTSVNDAVTRLARKPAEDVVEADKPPAIPAREARPAERHFEAETPPTTRVYKAKPAAPQAAGQKEADRTVLVRGKQQIFRGTFERDPVVAFLVIVGGPGLGQFRPVFEGNNTIGRASSNRIAFDFGDDSISADSQAYLRYDSTDRTFLFVPNLAKTNVVSINDRRPTSAVPLQAMDLITIGRTQVAFLPFCGSEFDWSEISDDRG